MNAVEYPNGPAAAAAPPAPSARANLPIPVPTNNVYRLKLIGQVEEQVTVTTFYYDDNAAIGPASSVNAGLLKESFVGLGGPYLLFLDCVTADWNATKVVIDSPTSPTMAAQEWAQADPGTGPVPHLPTQMAASILKKTAFRGQCGRGRWALPAVPASWCALSRITNKVKYDAFMTNAKDALVNGGVRFTPILFSTFTPAGQAPRIGVAGITDLVLNEILGTSRRRKLGVGI